jgi:2-polyprenyl-6-methoxyphenol hydroxylase-like FAD-dependent oxidoreductase
MTERRVLISGAGIAGPTLAYWLFRAGWTPAIVERAV